MENQKNKHDSVIKNLRNLLKEGNAHVSLDEALKDIPFKLLGDKPHNLPYSIWQLAQHIRITQWDLLEFSRNAQHISPKWPDEYWPSEPKPVSEEEWKKCVQQIISDRKAFMGLLENPEANIYQPFDYGDGQSLLKEALVLADHNSYHTGQIILLRRLLNAWN